MKQFIITLTLLLGLNLSAQEQKAYQLEDGTIRLEQFYSNGQVQQVSYYWGKVGIGTWFKYDEQGNLIAKAEMKKGRPVRIFRYENGIVTIIDRNKRSITQMKD
jgi:antitoxin component YwqK of YwqJK toxin-antitoxin module